jgi:hypothetical protein
MKELLRAQGEELKALCEEHKVSPSRLDQLRIAKFPRIWDVDHITPLCEGGANVLENSRTLCLVCHRKINNERYELGQEFTERMRSTLAEMMSEFAKDDF